MNLCHPGPMDHEELPAEDDFDDVIGSEDDAEPGTYVLSTRRPGVVGGPS